MYFPHACLFIPNESDGLFRLLQARKGYEKAIYIILIKTGASPITNNTIKVLKINQSINCS
jgi:hypothetical protein